jgi:energy-coupling factor transport system permease protein
MQTVYYESNSFLHRLNPLSKLLVSFPLFIFLLFTTDPWTPLLFSTLTVFLLLVAGKVPARRFARILTPIFILALSFLILYPLLIRASLVDHTPLLFQLGPIRIFEGGLQAGIVSSLRVLALMLLSLPFSLTTDSADFVRALVQQWRLPYRIGYSTLAAFRFVPMLQNELAVIQAAHRVRGVSATHGWRGNYERVRRYAVPLLATAIRQAERTALAMDGRAFGAFPERSYFRRTRFTWVDWAFMLGMWLLSALALWGLKAAGLLGPLAFVQVL